MPLPRSLLLTVAILLGTEVGFAQGIQGRWSSAPTARGAAPSGNSAPSSGQAGGQTTGRAGSAPASSTGNFGFPARLGFTVGLQAPPVMPMPPGVGNINHPGVAPSIQPSPSMQPLPNGTPNINFPGGIPAPQRNPGTGNYGRNSRRYSSQAGGSIVYYGVPYYVPYYVAPSDSAEAGSAVPSGVVVIPAPYPPANVTAGTSSFPPPLQPSGQSSGQLEEQAEGGSTITLLAMKDHTILAVTDYWLEGESLYYKTEPGQQASVLLSQVDFALTQQLNRERNVRFILESR